MRLFLFRNGMYKNNLGIKAWAEEDRPREKLVSKGRSAVSTSELLSILIRTGTSRRSAVDISKDLLSACHQNLNNLAKLSVDELVQFRGIGQAKAIAIVAALELGRRRRSESAVALPEIHAYRMAYEFILPYLEDLRHEEFWVAYLNKKNRVLRCTPVSRGGISETIVDNRIIFSTAVKILASSIILFHNHPSGSPKPSRADDLITKKIVAASQLLDIKVLDHLIIGDQSYYSFGDEGRI
jgi:DNA repair protein RadC